MVNIVNQGTLGGGFKHFSGLVPVQRGSGDSHHASTELFHLDATHATAIFRGDIATYADSSHGVLGSGDLAYNITAPSASVVIGGGGGTGLGNNSMAPNAARWVAGDTTSVILGPVVGFGTITLYMAKNGFQYVPALVEAWLTVDTDPDIECYITCPTVPSASLSVNLGSGADVQENAGQQATRFGISGVSLNATLATTSTLPLRVLSSGDMIGNDVTATGLIVEVTFNKTRHFRGTGAFVAD